MKLITGVNSSRVTLIGPGSTSCEAVMRLVIGGTEKHVAGSGLDSTLAVLDAINRATDGKATIDDVILVFGALVPQAAA